MARQLAALVASTLFMGFAPCLADGQEKADTPPADKAFDNITPKQIAAALKEAEKTSGNKIDASDTKDNSLPTGTIVVYTTSEGKLGKLKVIEYGKDLTVQWVTYDEGGKVASKGDKLTIKASFTADLDAGKPGEKGAREKDDFWWENKDKTTRFLVPMNKAVFVVYGTKK